MLFLVSTQPASIACLCLGIASSAHSSAKDKSTTDSYLPFYPCCFCSLGVSTPHVPKPKLEKRDRSDRLSWSHFLPMNLDMPENCGGWNGMTIRLCLLNEEIMPICT
jgi:hypothetical protein